jgi:hypothetical protein
MCFLSVLERERLVQQLASGRNSHSRFTVVQSGTENVGAEMVTESNTRDRACSQHSTVDSFRSSSQNCRYYLSSSAIASLNIR